MEKIAKYIPQFASGMILIFGPDAHAQANAVAARMAKRRDPDGEATWKAIAQAIERAERSSAGTGCPNCGAPRSQLTLDCREFSSGAAGLITCRCKKCGHNSAAY
jgi:hypothetical protein